MRKLPEVTRDVRQELAALPHRGGRGQPAELGGGGGGGGGAGGGVASPASTAAAEQGEKVAGGRVWVRRGRGHEAGGGQL